MVSQKQLTGNVEQEKRLAMLPSAGNGLAERYSLLSCRTTLLLIEGLED
jgi:hypothetical protein